MGVVTLALACLDIRTFDWNNLLRGVSLDTNLGVMTHRPVPNSRPQIVRFVFRDWEQ